MKIRKIINLKIEWIVLVLCLGVSEILCGCTSTDSTPSDIKDIATSLNSAYTICYKNDDKTYDLYIYATPIQCFTDTGYQLIDNTLTKSKEKGYSFENKFGTIKSCFPKDLKTCFKVSNGKEEFLFSLNVNGDEYSKAKKLNHINIFGDTVEAVSYESKVTTLIFYPVNTGIKGEMITDTQQQEISFEVKAQDALITETTDSYIAFRRANISGFVQSLPFFKDNHILSQK